MYLMRMRLSGLTIVSSYVPHRIHTARFHVKKTRYIFKLWILKCKSKYTEAYPIPSSFIMYFSCICVLEVLSMWHTVAGSHWLCHYPVHNEQLRYHCYCKLLMPNYRKCHLSKTRRTNVEKFLQMCCKCLTIRTSHIWMRSHQDTRTREEIGTRGSDVEL